MRVLLQWYVGLQVQLYAESLGQQLLNFVQVYRIRAEFNLHSLKLKAFKSLFAFTDRQSYLEPTDPDDQEVDYDNIWEYDRETGMIQSVPGISTHWTGLDFEAQCLGPVATPQRWS